MIKFEYGVKVPADQLLPGHIYLDGAAQGGPVVDTANKTYNFDHHEGCIRAFTLATCQQVHLARQLGFNPEGLYVVCNDLDADNNLSVWLTLVDMDVINDPRVIDLVNRIGFVDAHGPAVPGHDPHPLHFVLGAKFNETQSLALLDQKLDLLDSWYKTGQVPAPRPESPVEAFGLTANLELINLGPVNGFQDVYAQGCVVGVVAVPGADNTTGWTIGKISDFVSYDVQAFLSRCNQLESGWGGGSTIGGAPRLEGGKRSSLTVDQIKSLL